ncbi:hypothetical protein LGQ02_18460 [Bacillus shivajii]|uniref:hypothetical protein n=1 Tax=Bacillus shivajii TaxID=1983719 RepID=UPI001CF9FB1F|nr:hypothetical protein [Bacillus shivajii]UCZ52743.1 hypothetical protein LGQ02_18460 [Bacillus shivajii]
MQHISENSNIESYVYEQTDGTLLILGFVYHENLEQTVQLELKDSGGNIVELYETKADEFGYFELHRVKNVAGSTYDIFCVNHVNRSDQVAG